MSPNDSITGTAAGAEARAHRVSETRRPGLLVFALGIVLLVTTFALAIAAYWSARGAGSDLSYLPIAAQFAFLVVLAYTGSLIASKGIELYTAGQASDQPPHA